MLQGGGVGGEGGYLKVYIREVTLCDFTNNSEFVVAKCDRKYKLYKYLIVEN